MSGPERFSGRRKLRSPREILGKKRVRYCRDVGWAKAARLSAARGNGRDVGGGGLCYETDGWTKRGAAQKRRRLRLAHAGHGMADRRDSTRQARRMKGVYRYNQG